MASLFVRPKKKKIVEDSQGPVNIMDDINKTINKQEEASYECPFCFEELVPPYPEELRKAIEETKKKQSMLDKMQFLDSFFVEGSAQEFEKTCLSFFIFASDMLSLEIK